LESFSTFFPASVDSLGLILSLVVGSLIAGTLVTTFGYYTPLMIASSVMMAIGGGLITTFRTDTGTAHWLGYQGVRILFCFV
jgi:hypothetical protein